ncbi:transcriptional regulator with XRE-family HTH domain [Variovorax boronicumulans]|uniref:helix-turn-helix domain-containing protein n=1 Tax=Variovorax boronicumulans TaxID=436515 RepID=UPI00278B867D|nr:helix-turn-helix domain-containing protein [Variovorax boronicumulans]MDQ0038942.1 transcriptional regulator with XRE-family HTH domain [Variovorax boronicumulans]
MTAGNGTKTPSGIARGTLPNAVTLALGRNLRYFREQAGLTQVELAFDAEVERSRISKIERGHINPSLLTLATLCYCLKITLPTLFDGIKETLAPSWKGGELRRSNQAVLGASSEKVRGHR